MITDRMIDAAFAAYMEVARTHGPGGNLRDALRRCLEAAEAETAPKGGTRISTVHDGIRKVLDQAETATGGSGARGALIEILKNVELRHGDYPSDGCASVACDVILSNLWDRGFKVAPLEEGDENPWHVPTMQLGHLRSWVGRKLWAIVDMPNGMFQVYHQTPDGVAPPSEYPSLRKAAARILQLLGTGAVAPQTWPEDVCVGQVSVAPSTDEPPTTS